MNYPMHIMLSCWSQTRFCCVQHGPLCARVVRRTASALPTGRSRISAASHCGSHGFCCRQQQFQQPSRDWPSGKQQAGVTLPIGLLLHAVPVGPHQALGLVVLDACMAGALSDRVHWLRVQQSAGNWCNGFAGPYLVSQAVHDILHWS